MQIFMQRATGRARCPLQRARCLTPAQESPPLVLATYPIAQRVIIHRGKYTWTRRLESVFRWTP